MTVEQIAAEPTYQMPLIGKKAASFEVVTTQGDINFPADFTPVCTTDFMAFAKLAEEFEELNTELVGLSVDSLYAHIAWFLKIQELEWNGMKNLEVKFPLIEDLTRMILYYPLEIGRNFDELKRIIQALQKTDADNVATPADWRPGDDVIIPTPGSCGTAKERMESDDEDQYCLDWFMCFRKES